MYIGFADEPATKTLLLGIDWGHHPVPIPEREKYGAQSAGIADVVLAWKPAELLDLKEHVRVRDDAARTWAVEHPGGNAVSDLQEE